MEPLLPVEVERLERCETVIKNGLGTFFEVGTALLEIRDSRLYKAAYGTFDDYLRERWNVSKAYAYRLIQSAQILGDLSPIGDKPTTESQVRPLALLPPERRSEAFSRAAASAPNGRTTGKHVQAVVDEIIKQDAAEQARVEATEPDGAERLCKHFLKCLDNIEDLTRAVAARVHHGGYDGFSNVLAHLRRDEVPRVRGEIEILIERLQGWMALIPEDAR